MSLKKIVKKTLKQTIRLLLHVIVGASFIILLPGIPPYITYESFTVTPAIKLEGELAPQYVLDKAVKLIDGELRGAESIVTKGDSLYAGVGGGRVVKIQDKKAGKTIEVIASIGKPCGNENNAGNEDQICVLGVPGGIRFDSDENLVLVDATHGIANINVKTGKVKYHFTTDTPLTDGTPTTFPNDLDISKDKVIYWSQFVSNYPVEEFGLDKIGDSSGRLLKFDPKTKTNTVLLSGLFGANGVQLSEKEDFILVGESFKSRVSRFYLKGPKAGSSDVFVDGLPGLVDNIRPNGRGGYYVALFAPRTLLIDAISEFPLVQKFVFRLQWLTLQPINLLNLLGIQNHLLSHLQLYLSNMGPFGMNFNAKPVVIDLSASGKILRVLTTDNDEMQQVTQLIVGNNYAYMGSFFNQQIWKIAVKDLNAQLK